MITFDKEKWLSERRRYITASDTAAILGLNPYSDAADVRMQKLTGSNKDLSSVARVVAGTYLEGGIFDWFVSRRPDLAGAVRNTELLVSKELHCLAATPDGWHTDSSGRITAIEIKNVGGFSARAWQIEPAAGLPRPSGWDAFADGGLAPKNPLAAPAQYVTQLMTQLNVLDAVGGWLVACVGGQALYCVYYERDRAWEQRVLLPACERFWAGVQRA
jgi:hypothetical protein